MGAVHVYKRKFRPREEVYSMVIDTLHSAYHNKLGELDALSPSEVRQTKLSIKSLYFKLAKIASLDVIPLYEV